MTSTTAGSRRHAAAASPAGCTNAARTVGVAAMECRVTRNSSTWGRLCRWEEREAAPLPSARSPPCPSPPTPLFSHPLARAASTASRNVAPSGASDARAAAATSASCVGKKGRRCDGERCVWACALSPASVFASARVHRLQQHTGRETLGRRRSHTRERQTLRPMRVFLPSSPPLLSHLAPPPRPLGHLPRQHSHRGGFQLVGCGGGRACGRDC